MFALSNIKKIEVTDETEKFYEGVRGGETLEIMDSVGKGPFIGVVKYNWELIVILAGFLVGIVLFSLIKIYKKILFKGKEI
jgi:hypothetical protein